MLRLTVLIENSAPDHLIAEHGLSLHLDYEGHSYLLDSGTSGLFVRNADRLGIDLSRRGLPLPRPRRSRRRVLRLLPAQPTGPGTGPPRRGPGLSGGYRRSFPPPGRCGPGSLYQWAGRFDLADGPRLLAPGLHLIPDAVSHEQSLVAETAHGLVVMNSCCHAGAAHIVHEVRALFPTQKVHPWQGDGLPRCAPSRCASSPAGWPRSWRWSRSVPVTAPAIRPLI